MLNKILYYSFLQDLNFNNIDYTIIGSHALYILNKKHNLNLSVDLTKKDLDIVISLQDIEYLKKIYNYKYNFFKTETSNVRGLEFYRACFKIKNHTSKHTKIDLIYNHIKNYYFKYNSLILDISHKTLLNHRFEDIIYDTKVNCINLDIYYAIIKRTGLKKYKNVIESISPKKDNSL